MAIHGCTYVPVTDAAILNGTCERRIMKDEIFCRRGHAATADTLTVDARAGTFTFTAHDTDQDMDFCTYTLSGKLSRSPTGEVLLEAENAPISGLHHPGGRSQPAFQAFVCVWDAVSDDLPNRLCIYCADWNYVENISVSNHGSKTELQFDLPRGHPASLPGRETSTTQGSRALIFLGKI